MRQHDPVLAALLNAAPCAVPMSEELLARRENALRAVAERDFVAKDVVERLLRSPWARKP